MDRRAFLKGSIALTSASLRVQDVRASPVVADSRPSEGGRAAFDAQSHTDHLFEHIPRRLEFREGMEVAVWQGRLRPRLRELLGVTLLEQEERFEHRAERAETVRLDGYTREKWYLWTERLVPLPIWVLIPDQPARTPWPLVLAVHGHNHPEVYLGIAADDAEKRKIAEGERDIAVQAARQGYLCVLLTARGFGETRRADDRKAGKTHSCRTGLMHGMLFGRTMIGARVWDVSRVIDWISRRHEVDPQRIAITGNSGGGTTSLFAAACDERVRVAMPSCYFCTFRASIGSIYHCECNYVPGLLREAEMYDVAGLIAPRPFLAIAGKTDPIFPVDAVRASYERLSRIYRSAGAADRCELFVGDGGHRYYKEPAWRFVKRHFA